MATTSIDPASQAATPRTFKRRVADSAGALGVPRYRRYWLGSLASVGAIQVAQLGMNWYIAKDLGGSASTLGYLGGAIAIPTIIVNLFGGVLADRIDRRHIIIAISAFTASLLTLLAFLVVQEIAEIWHVVVIAGLMGFAQGFDGPVRSSFFPLLIDRKHMMSAVALNSVMWQFSRIVTPSIAGFAITLMGTASIFFAGAIGWITMLIVIISLKVPHAKPAVQRKVTQELAEGIRFIRSHRLFSTIIPLTFANMFFGMQYMTLMPLVAFRHDRGADGYGLIFTFLGIGAVTGTIIIGKRQRSRHIGKIMLGGTFLFSLLIMAFAFAPNYYLAIAFMYFAGVANSIFLISSMTALQLRVPPELRGRVMGIYTITFSLIPAGGLVGGQVADALDERWAMTISAGVLSLIVAFVFLTQPLVRNLDGKQLEADQAKAEQS